MRTTARAMRTAVCVMRTAENCARDFERLIEIRAYGFGNAVPVAILDGLPGSPILERPRLYLRCVDVEAIQLIERIPPLTINPHLALLPFLCLTLGASSGSTVLIRLRIQLKLRTLPYLR